MYSVKDIFEDVKKGTQFGLCFGEFLDEFYAAQSQEKALMISKEPIRHEAVERYLYAYAASAIHKLANDYGLTVPAWVFPPTISCPSYILQ